MNSQAHKDSTAGHVEGARTGPGESETYRWRLDQLVRAGYDESRAQELAASGEVNLHVACDLLARGCPEATAFAILA